MAKIKKKIVQRSEEVRKQRRKLLSMERTINAGLRDIDPRYEIRNLIRRPDGTIEFEAEIEFDPAHAQAIEPLFSLLHDDVTDFVQAKYYLPREVREKVKRRALDLHVPVSSLVAAILAREV